MRSASIRRMQEKRKKYANCFICVWGETERQREAVSSKEGERGWEKMTDVAGGKERSVWERQPLRDCALNPLPRLNPPPSSLPPCVLCHGYQTGLPMQPVNVFFSGRSELGTNVSQSVSCTINVNCPGMHKHMEGLRAREHWATLAECQGERLKEDHVTFICSPENCRLFAGALLSSQKNNATSFIYYILIIWNVFFYVKSDWVSKNVSYAA